MNGEPVGEKRNPDFGAAVMLEGEFPEEIKLTWEPLQPVADGFTANFRRAHLSIAFALDLAVLATLRQMSLDLAHEALGLPLVAEIGEMETRDVFALQERIFADKHRSVMEDPTGLLATFRDGFAYAVSGTKELHDHVQTTFASMLVNAWTAFETASTDLWVEALNSRPKPLALSAIKTPRSGNEPSEEVRSEKSEILNFIFTLVKNDEPIRAGNLLKQSSRFSFMGFAGIKDAYVSAFGRPAKDVFEEEPFRTLRVLEAVRNVLVHRAGKIDRMYLNRAMESKVDFRRIGLEEQSENDQIFLDGPMVRQFEEAVYKASQRLFKFADDWYTIHS